MEINDRAFVTIMLVDTVEDSQDTQLTLGFQLPNQMIPGQSGGGSASSGDPYTYITKNGETISDAFEKSKVIYLVKLRLVKHILL